MYPSVTILEVDEWKRNTKEKIEKRFRKAQHLMMVRSRAIAYLSIIEELLESLK